MAQPKIFVSSPGYDAADPDTGARLTAAGYAIDLKPRTGNRTPEELSALLASAIGAVASTDPFTAEVFSRTPQLRVIARTGVGADSIDLAAATRHGVAVALAPGLNVDAVADQAMAMILALVRKIVVQDTTVKAGRWERTGDFLPTEMPGKTVGVIGAGAIGRAVMRRLAGFGIDIVYFDPVAADVTGGTRTETLDALLAASDIVTIHAPLAPETRHLINAGTIARMKPTAYVVNTARGPLIDQPALFAALREGRLGGAALDVFDTEPPDVAEFASIPNLIVSAHVAGISREALRRLSI
jgi:phosphoglycerate dehydrogenase-like enzyme